MSALNGTNLQVVLYEGPGSSPLSSDDRFEALSSLLVGGYSVSLSDSGGGVVSADSPSMLVLGRFDTPPPIETDANHGDVKLHFRDISGLDGPGVLVEVKKIGAEEGAREPGGWKPWFPVIDYDRCTNCMQCLSFCLFDVYGVGDKDQIQVQHNDNCKTDCPACSRVCPEVAILFPKYGKGPINGDIVREEDIQRESMKVDISALLGGDIYSTLRNRQTEARKRFSTERDESKALLERKRCLKKLQGDLGIPDEVLMSLPSVGDIQERTERAKAKMAKRLARSQTVKDQRPAPSVEEWGI